MTDDPAGRLAAILSLENDALERVDYAAAVATLADKETALAALAQSPLPSADQLQRLRHLANTNRLLLERAIAVQTNVVRIVARACAPPPAMSHYRRNGSESPRPRADALALSARV